MSLPLQLAIVNWAALLIIGMGLGRDAIWTMIIALVLAWATYKTCTAIEIWCKWMGIPV